MTAGTIVLIALALTALILAIAVIVIVANRSKSPSKTDGEKPGNEGDGDGGEDPYRFCPATFSDASGIRWMLYKQRINYLAPGHMTYMNANGQIAIFDLLHLEQPVHYIVDPKSSALDISELTMLESERMFGDKWNEPFRQEDPVPDVPEEEPEAAEPEEEPAPEEEPEEEPVEEEQPEYQQNPFDAFSSTVTFPSEEKDQEEEQKREDRAWARRSFRSIAAPILKHEEPEPEEEEPAPIIEVKPEPAPMELEPEPEPEPEPELPEDMDKLILDFRTSRKRCSFDPDFINYLKDEKGVEPNRRQYADLQSLWYDIAARCTIKRWREENPGRSAVECARETGLTHNLVNTHWNGGTEKAEKKAAEPPAPKPAPAATTRKPAPLPKTISTKKEQKPVPPKKHSYTYKGVLAKVNEYRMAHPHATIRDCSLDLGLPYNAVYAVWYVSVFYTAENTENISYMNQELPTIARVYLYRVRHPKAGSIERCAELLKAKMNAVEMYWRMYDNIVFSGIDVEAIITKKMKAGPVTSTSAPVPAPAAPISKPAPAPAPEVRFRDYAESILNWRSSHPSGTMQQCRQNTGIPMAAIQTWWKDCAPARA